MQRFAPAGCLFGMTTHAATRSMTEALILLGLLASCLVGQGAGRAEAADTRPCGRIIFSSIAKSTKVFKSVKRNGTDIRRVASQNHSSFSISPDGSTIAYDTFLRGDVGSDIWLVDSDGNDNRRLTETEPESEGDIAWAPDSRSVAVTIDGELSSEAAVIDVLTGETTQIAQGREPHFSPDGSSLVFSSETETAGGSSYDLFVVDLDTRVVRPLTSDPVSDERTPRWSPDGQWIVFNRFPHDQLYMDENSPFSDLWRIRPDGTEEANLTNIQGDEFGVSAGAWSPNGRLIAYNTIQAQEFDGWEYLEIVSVSGHNRTERLLGARGQRGSQIAWSPNGRQIVFQRYRKGWDIWRYGLYSGERQRLTRTDAYDERPQWVSCTSS